MTASIRGRHCDRAALGTQRHPAKVTARERVKRGERGEPENSPQPSLGLRRLKGRQTITDPGCNKEIL